jgi:hypothetical protein
MKKVAKKSSQRRNVVKNTTRKNGGTKATRKPRPRKKSTARELGKFGILVLILIAYAGWMIYENGWSDGLGATFLGWAFTILCVPISIGGFLVAFPIRLLFNVKMYKTQVVAIVVALVGAILFLIFDPFAFAANVVIELFRTILTTPWPYWILIVLSIAGSIVSILFGDEVYDSVADHAKKHHPRVHRHLGKIKWILTIALYAATVVIYLILLKRLGLDIPLF